jgi:protein phosphatase
MANVAIWKKAEEEPRYQGMGTTLVGARFALLKRRVYIGHVGDSRCYRFRAGGIKQLTKDHTLSALGVEGPAGTQLVRAVGIRPKMDMDIITAEPRVDDVYLFCSDGLSKVVPEEEMTRVLREDERDLQQAATRLIELATQAGGRDNITVVLVGVRPAP